MALFKKHGNWYIDYWFEGNRIRERVGPSKRAAEQAIAIRKTKIIQGRFEIRCRKKDISFKELTDQYLKYSQTTKLSFERDCDMVTHLLDFFGNRRIAELGPHHVEQYKMHRRQEILSRPKYKERDPRDVPMSTINRELACLKRIFNLAIQWEKAERNPVKGVKFFREEKFQERVLTDEEVDLVLLCCNKITQDVVVFALNTGMRRGEIMNLKWDQVNLRDGYITVIRTKSGKNRIIPINENVRRVLESLPRNSEYIFHRNGKPAKSVRTTYEKAVKMAGIGHCRFHDLRHTFATRLVLAGVSLPVVQRLLGHSTITTTMRYTHPTPESERSAVALLDKATHDFGRLKLAGVASL